MSHYTDTTCLTDRQQYPTRPSGAVVNRPVAYSVSGNVCIAAYPDWGNVGQASGEDRTPLHGASVRQLDGSAPIFSPRSARAFIVSLSNVPGLRGTKSSGTATMRTSIVAPRSSREIAAWANRCRRDAIVAARVPISRLRATTAGQVGSVTWGSGRSWLLKITQ